MTAENAGLSSLLLSLQPSWLLIYDPSDILKWKTNLQIIYNKKLT